MKKHAVDQMEIVVRTLLKSDYAYVASIYAEGIATGMATFETTVLSWEVWDKKYLNTCRLIAVFDDEVRGFAVLS